jgi:hypothetical protein
MKTEKSKNLVVIIGNGFDRAHGLETSYNDFSDYYLNEVIFNEIINFDDKSEFFHKKHKERLIKPEYIRYQISEGIAEERKLDKFIFNSKEKNKELIIDYLINHKHMLKHIISNVFLAKLYSNSYANWFEIEQAYFTELKYILNGKREGLLKKLNIDFQEIKNAFKDYLSSKIKPEEKTGFFNSFKEHFKKRKQIAIVNFNYTKTIDLYNNRLNFKNYHIHGDINNEIIFGYGDDTDETYNEMKKTKNIEYLRFFKTFDYLKTTNYRSTLNAIEIFNEYDVLVIGHSLDTTDKTILRTILDNDKCNYIELLKRPDLETEKEKEEAHFELHANLSRIFNSEKDLREKVISFEWSVNFPFLDDQEYTNFINREKELYKQPSKTSVRVINS